MPRSIITATGTVHGDLPLLAVVPLVAPVTRSAAVVEQLRTAIIDGTLAPGSPLPEVALASRLGVSPTPVREAIAHLMREGLVEVEAHRLKRVAPIDFPAMYDLLKVQAHLWRIGYIWGMAKVRAPDLDRLGEAVEDYRAALARNDPLAAIRAGHAFHSIVILASANRELLRFTLDRRALIARFILLHGRATISRVGLRHHEAMLAAFQRGDHANLLTLLDQLATRLIATAAPEPAPTA